MLIQPFIEFWGKARPNPESGVAMHSLVAHSLDVASVAILMPSAIRIGLDGRTLAFLVSLHDIGKFSRPFQAQAVEHWPARALGRFDPDTPPPTGPKHDALALSILNDVVGDLLEGVLPPRSTGRQGWSNGHRSQLFHALAGHHGKPAREPLTPGPRVLCNGCRDAARDYVMCMLDVFRPPPLTRPDERMLRSIEWGLAGLVTLADWVGSRAAWFPYTALDALADPARYFWSVSTPRAASALSAAGLAYASPSRFKGLRDLFPAIKAPSPVQDWAERVVLPEGPLLAVIEDLTGSGKTEAALVLSHRLLASGRADGVFLALPTMATANAMYDRVADAYRRLFRDEAHPSLALVHGRALLDPRFARALEDTVPAVRAAQTAPAASSSDPSDQPAEAHCSAWLADDRRRALLAHVGVGTIDQALLAILPVRHATLRLQGLRGKVLVVDEAHAFDPYMHRELIELLRFHAFLGGSAVLLSATLPFTTRQRLVDAFRDGLGVDRLVLRERAYPLATLAGAASLAEHACDVREGLKRDVIVTRVPDPASALERIVAAAGAGAAVAWIRNTVDDALEAAAMIREAGIEPIVFHARFALRDRFEVEDRVLRRFGRDGAGADRACVLVATQVVEQSLDLDFDLLCTDLAPVDRLIQRAGRLWRHARGPRPLLSPELLILSPRPVADPGPGWIAELLPGTASVYPDWALLWRSARAIFSRPILRTPDDMRPLIETVSDSDAPDAVPAALSKAALRAAGKNRAATGIASQNVLVWEDGYRDGSGAWEPDTQTPTRLEERPEVTLRLARCEGDRVMPYAAAAGMDEKRAWSLSELKVARHRLATCAPPLKLEAACKAARADWGRWERDSDQFLLALLSPSDDKGEQAVTGTAEDGSLCIATYTPHEGLRWSPRPAA